MHLTDWLGLGAQLLPRPLKKALQVLLIVGLMTGLATPLVKWWVETKAHEMTSDLMPAIERLVPSATATR